MLTPYLPYPPSSGGQIRSYNLIKQLSKKHEITLCSLIKYDDQKQYVAKLEPFCKKVYVFKRPEKPWTLSNILNTGFSLFPFLVVRNFSPTEKMALRKIVQEEDFDIIHAETFYVSPHIPKTNIPLVLVDQTIEYQVYRHYVDNFKFPFLKPILHIDVSKMKYWETYYWKKAARVIAVSENDAKAMRILVDKNKVRVVPNGVGEDLIENVPLHFNETVIFVGNFLWLQNAEAARVLTNDVFPLIAKKIPDVKLLIVGQNTEKIKDLKEKNLNLEILDVGDDIESLKKAFRESGVLVAPLYGPGGTRLKILGAMAAKLPVVTTKTGLSDLKVVDGESVLLGETAQELANLTIKILNDKELYKKIANNARSVVETEYSYESIAKRLGDVYEEVANG